MEENLTPEQYKVCKRKVTEPPFSWAYVNSKDNGIYMWVCCGNELFSAEYKFDSGTGWPSFTHSIRDENVEKHSDLSYGMHRTEVTCSKFGAYLWHVFNDGPNHTGNRFCINSVALKLHNKEITLLMK